MLQAIHTHSASPSVAVNAFNVFFPVCKRQTYVTHMRQVVDIGGLTPWRYACANLPPGRNKRRNTGYPQADCLVEHGHQHFSSWGQAGLIKIITNSWGMASPIRLMCQIAHKKDALAPFAVKVRALRLIDVGHHMHRHTRDEMAEDILFTLAHHLSHGIVMC